MEDPISIRRDAIDALHAHVAMLDKTGCIVAVNKHWRRFGRQNGATSDYVGVNYFEACSGLAATGDRGANRVVNGLRRVVDRRTSSFGMVYLCGPRTFRMRAVRVHDEPLRILVAHEDITVLLDVRRELDEANVGLQEMRAKHAERIAEAYEELSQRLAAIGLASVALERSGLADAAALATIRLAVDEARREARKLRYQAELEAVEREP